MSRPDRSDVVGRVHTALITIARRGSVRRQARSTLSRVEESLLAHLAAHPGERAIDIADQFQLNRSTVSRQLAGLIERGLVADADGAAVSRRGQPLSVTARGAALLEGSDDSMLSIIDERMRAWPDADVARFADLLERFNTDPEE
ncbi:MarR family winged helix-turn-helix transcriptional regulator [Microbacterium sp. ASV49]|uniref:MarR family transcriptional regulator n=1 Tax=Microbacterium candidum TaxID=3041922 RepID=A0ABT7N0F8_9MICO|nr:MarR family transcriptional regulator [Microbacterium sp. ASV49]MDL9980146.1 MarR family transcriptional regulator [Microbacterium sp. ASV49]